MALTDDFLLFKLLIQSKKDGVAILLRTTANTRKNRYVENNIRLLKETFISNHIYMKIHHTHVTNKCIEINKREQPGTILSPDASMRNLKFCLIT